MKQLDTFPVVDARRIRGLFVDIDDTLTTDGRLTAAAYQAIELLHEAALLVIPVTGRPAGWCDHIARMWPVDAVVGENGAFYFRYDQRTCKMHRRFVASESVRQENRQRLDTLCKTILEQIPGAGVSADQRYREADLAIDFKEDVATLDDADVQQIVALFVAAGACAKVSSIHVNGWFGDYDKLSMTRLLMAECFQTDLDESKEEFVFVGDSPNDAPMFGYFPNAVAVANIKQFADSVRPLPAYVTRQESGAGLCEVADMLLRSGMHLDL